VPCLDYDKNSERISSGDSVGKVGQLHIKNLIISYYCSEFRFYCGKPTFVQNTKLKHHRKTCAERQMIFQIDGREKSAKFPTWVFWLLIYYLIYRYTPQLCFKNILKAIKTNLRSSSAGAFLKRLSKSPPKRPTITTVTQKLKATVIPQDDQKFVRKIDRALSDMTSQMSLLVNTLSLLEQRLTRTEDKVLEMARKMNCREATTTTKSAKFVDCLWWYMCCF